MRVASQLLTPTMGVIRAAQVAGLFYVWRNVVQVATSYPIGALADRYGQRSILVVGYALDVLTAALAAIAFAAGVDSLAVLTAIFFIAGFYVAVEEALESTVTAEMVSAHTLATSYSALGAVNGAAKFISSPAVGVLWTAVSPTAGFGAAAILMAAGTFALLRRR